MSKTPPKKTGCLLCGDSSQRLRRGLCAKHYTSFHRNFSRLTGEAQERFDAAAVEKGLVLPRKKPGPQNAEDPFEALAAELFADTQAMIEQGKAEIEEAVSERRKPEKRRNNRTG